MSKVHDVDAVEKFQVVAAYDDALKRSSADILPAISEFKEQLGKICETINSLKEKLEAVEAKEIEPEETLWERIVDNSLKDVFVGKDVTSDDVDGIVNTVTLMNALILTIPYGIMASAGYDYWDWVEDTLASCPKTKFTFDQDFNQFRNAFNAVIYSTISVLLLAMSYYLLRPKADKKFRRWWKFARYVIFIMLLGTITSCVSIVACTTWMFSWYMMPTSKLCTYSAWESGSTIIGVTFISVAFLISLFLML